MITKNKRQLTFPSSDDVQGGSLPASSWFQAIASNLNNEYCALYNEKVPIDQRFPQAGHKHDGVLGKFIPKPIFSESYGLPRYFNDTFSGTLDYLFVDTAGWDTEWINVDDAVTNPFVNGWNKYRSPSSVYYEDGKQYLLVERMIPLSAGCTGIKIAYKCGAKVETNTFTMRFELSSLQENSFYDVNSQSFSGSNALPIYRYIELDLPSRLIADDLYILRVGVLLTDQTGDFRLYNLSAAEKGD